MYKSLGRLLQQEPPPNLLYCIRRKSNGERNLRHIERVHKEKKMKAVIQFQITNEKGLNEPEIKEKLIDHMVEVMELWLVGEGTIEIEFVQTYETSDTDTDIYFD